MMSCRLTVDKSAMLHKRIEKTKINIQNYVSSLNIASRMLCCITLHRAGQ